MAAQEHTDGHQLGQCLDGVQFWETPVSILGAHRRQTSVVDDHCRVAAQKAGKVQVVLGKGIRPVAVLKRKNANRQMAELIKPLSDEQLALFADYISRQMPPQEKLADE